MLIRPPTTKKHVKLTAIKIGIVIFGISLENQMVLHMFIQEFKNIHRMARLWSWLRKVLVWLILLILELKNSWRLKSIMNSARNMTLSAHVMRMNISKTKKNNQYTLLKPKT